MYAVVHFVYTDTGSTALIDTKQEAISYRLPFFCDTELEDLEDMLEKLLPSMASCSEETACRGN